jgi:hypothetical protein
MVSKSSEVSVPSAEHMGNNESGSASLLYLTRHLADRYTAASEEISGPTREIVGGVPVTDTIISTILQNQQEIMETID